MHYRKSYFLHLLCLRCNHLSLSFVFGALKGINWSVEDNEILRLLNTLPGARGSVVVKALYYKPEGRGFDSR
jgi:hypothetical protein